MCHITITFTIFISDSVRQLKHKNDNEHCHLQRHCCIIILGILLFYGQLHTVYIMHAFFITIVLHNAVDIR